MIRIVLDTNILLISVSDKSDSYWLFDAFKKKKYELAFTTEILAEYEEQFSRHWNSRVAEAVVASILESPNGVATTIYYKLNLIFNDKDDNKFSDCAFASGATYLVTNDADFNILKKIDFPVIPVISLNEFKQILINRNIINP